MPSRSRISTAICARFAASATRFRSRMKASVLGAFCTAGAGGAKLCVLVVVVVVVVVVVEGSWRCAMVGEEIGASMAKYLRAESIPRV